MNDVGQCGDHVIVKLRFELLNVTYSSSGALLSPLSYCSERMYNSPRRLCHCIYTGLNVPFWCVSVMGAYGRNAVGNLV